MNETQAKKSKRKIARFVLCRPGRVSRFRTPFFIILGSACAFTIAVVVIVIWAATGPTFHFSNTWQLIINTGTTIVTFLMVCPIQNTQNRNAKAVLLNSTRSFVPSKALGMNWLILKSFLTTN
ncbi:MAG: low affinity iron permease family protein [Candidatus Udaeobacter sp.]